MQLQANPETKMTHDWWEKCALMFSFDHAHFSKLPKHSSSGGSNNLNNSQSACKVAPASARTKASSMVKRKISTSKLCSIVDQWEASSSKKCQLDIFDPKVDILLLKPLPQLPIIQLTSSHHALASSRSCKHFWSASSVSSCKTCRTRAFPAARTCLQQLTLSEGENFSPYGA